MKPRAVLLALVALLVAGGDAHGQGFRSAMGSARGVTSSAQTGTAAGFGLHTFQSSQTFATPPVASRQGQALHSPAATVFIQSPAQNRVGPQVITISPSPFHSRSPAVGFAKVPFFHHRHPHFFRRPGIVFIEVPAFTGTTITTTQFVPAGGWIESPVAGTPAADSRVRSAGQLAPFDPMPQEVVERVLALAGVRKGDLVYDLGSGDGRVVIAAAKKYGVKAVGFEIDPGLVKLARENVRREKLENLVEIRQQDFMTADLSKASVVTLYLSYDGNLALQPKLMRELRAGARVVSYTFDMGGWEPKVVESYRDAGGDTHLLYLWEISEPPLYSEHSTEELR